MVKRTLLFLAVAGTLFSSAVCLAQESPYVQALMDMNEKVQELDKYVKENPLTIEYFEGWYNAFKPAGEKFVKQYFATDVKKQSYQIARDGVNNMAMVWNSLSQAKKNDAEYVESMSGGDVIFARKWRNKAKENREKANELLPATLNSFDKAVDLAENDE